MRRRYALLRYSAITLGVISSLSFMMIFYIFSTLYPKMIRFEMLGEGRLNLMNFVGIGLLVFFFFCLLTLLRTAIYIKNCERITFFSLSLIIMGLLSLILIFSDIALLGDIVKQYKLGLSQPEWYLVFPIISFQFITALIFTYTHIFKVNKYNQEKYIAQDSNVFLIVQYIGVICGFLGLSFSSLGFFYPGSWSLNIHTTSTMIILLFPYALAVIFWFLMKIREKSKQFFDEKQRIDIGKSAFMTLLIIMIFMLVLFVTNYNNLRGVISMLWCPLVLFCTLFSFSLGTLVFARRD